MEAGGRVEIRIARVREADGGDPGDLGRVWRFYESNPSHLFIKRRDDLVINRENVVFFAESQTSGLICAAAVARPTQVRGYVELCASRTLSEFRSLRPFGLHEIFICLRSVYADVIEGRIPFAATISSDEKAVQNLTAQGFEPWEPPTDLQEEVSWRTLRGQALDPPPMSFFRLSDLGARAQIKQLRAFLGQPGGLALTRDVERIQIYLEMHDISAAVSSPQILVQAPD